MKLFLVHCLASVLLFVFLEEEFKPFGFSRGECYLTDGPALVLPACQQAHDVPVVKPIKTKTWF